MPFTAVTTRIVQRGDEAPGEEQAGDDHIGAGHARGLPLLHARSPRCFRADWQRKIRRTRTGVSANVLRHVQSVCIPLLSALALMSCAPAAAQVVKVDGGSVRGKAGTGACCSAESRSPRRRWASCAGSRRSRCARGQACATAIDQPASCLQNDYGWNHGDFVIGNEDCLTLDVRTPGARRQAAGAGVDPRRKQPRGRSQRHRPLRRRQAGGDRRHPLPARHFRLPVASASSPPSRRARRAITG